MVTETTREGTSRHVPVRYAYAPFGIRTNIWQPVKAYGYPFGIGESSVKV